MVWLEMLSGVGVWAGATTTPRPRATADGVPGSADGRDAPGEDIDKECTVNAETVDLMKRDGLPDDDARVNAVCVLKVLVARLGNMLAVCDGECAEDVATEHEGVDAVSESLPRRWRSVR